MPRNRSEKVPHYSPAVTAWMIAWHRFISLHDIPVSEELARYSRLSDHERAHYGNLKAIELKSLAKQVYDAAQPK